MSYKQLPVDIFKAKVASNPNVVRRLDTATRELADVIAVDFAAGNSSYDVIWGSMPRLFQLHLTRGGAPDNPSLFALSFTEFARRFMARGIFKGIVTDDELIAAAFDMHCRGGELFVFGTGSERPVQLPVERADIELIRGLDASLSNSLFVESQSAVHEIRMWTQLMGMKGAAQDASSILMKASESTRAGDFAGMALLVNLLFDDGMGRCMQGMMDRWEEWFLVDLSDTVLAGASAAIVSIDAGDRDGAISAVDELLDQVQDGAKAIRSFGGLCGRLKGLSGLLESVVGDADESFDANLWSPSLDTVEMFIHDYGNMMIKVTGSIELLASKLAMGKRGVHGDFANLQETRESLKEILRSFDSSETGTVMRLVKWMLKIRSRGKIVVDAGEVGSLQIPTRVRRPLFRILFELGLNGVKNADEKKDEHRVDLGAALYGDFLRFTVEDNGVGMKNPDRAVRMGVRERPELAEGTGTGLASVMDLADRINAKVRFDSKLDIGTKVTVAVDTTGWGRGGGLGGGSGGGGVRTPIVLKQAQMTGAAHMLFGANPALIAFRPLAPALP